MRRTGVVINGRFLDQPASGVQRFAREIVRAMDTIRAAEPEHEANRLDMEILCPAPLPTAGLATIPVRAVGRMGGYLWEQVELPLAARGRLVLNLANMGPVLSRKITTVHDAIVWQMPGNYSRAFVAAYRVLLPVIVRTSRHCVTVSDHSRRCLVDLGVTGATPVSVVHNGIDHIRRDGGACPAGMRWPDRFVFALGNAAPNKNLALVRAIAPRLRREGIATVIAGGAHETVFAAAGGLHSDDVVELGRVPDAVIREAFQKALVFVFPSFHEGFGIPPLEAMALGCPVIASATSAMPEILGDAALLRDPGDPEQWLDAVLAIAGDPDLRASVISKGLRRADRFTWDAAARKMLSLLWSSTLR